MRATSSDKSEMTNQILFGELVAILEVSDNNKWLKVKTFFDHYEGWIDILQIVPVSDDYANSYLETKHIVTETNNAIITYNDQIYHIHKGSTIPFWDGEKGHIDGDQIEIKSLQSFEGDTSPKDIVNEALTYENTPYLWGGRTSFGIDCSGFAQAIFKVLGKHIPRDCYQQVTIGDEVTFEESKPGDLAFFIRDEKIIHVGIVLKEHKVIHARGWVRIDPLDQKGILDESNNTYSHHLHNIKRIKI